MLDIMFMDLRRLLGSPILYVSIFFVTIMAFAMALTGGVGETAPSLASLMGTVSTGNSGDDFMAGSMGPGVMVILAGIALSAFTCGDFSTGSAKGILSFHANPFSYIGGRMASMSIFSATLLVLYLCECCIALIIFGAGIQLPGGIVGLLVFLAEKQLIACAFLAILLAVCLALRNHAVGVVLAFLLATGGLSMSLPMLASSFGLPFLNALYAVTVSGTSLACSLTFSFGTLIRVLLVTAVWGTACIGASHLALKKRDV